MKKQSVSKIGRIQLQIPELLSLMVGTIFIVLVLNDLKQDTTWLLNAAFIVFATIAALIFGFAQVLDQQTKTRDRVTYAGERFLHAAILLIMVIIIRYAAYKILAIELPNIVDYIIYAVFGILGGPIFIWALLAAHAGLRIINKILITRMRRVKDWDDTFLA